MKIDRTAIPPETKIRFFDGLFEELVKYPFGSMPKRDMECLLVSLLEKNQIIAGSSRGIANALQINEQRLNGYLLDARYKFQPDTKHENIRRIFAAMKSGAVKPDCEGDKITFALENPVYRADLAQALKDIGYFADASFSVELVKIKNYAFFALLMAHCGPEAEAGLYKKLSEQSGADIKALQDNAFQNASRLEKAKIILKTINNTIPVADILQTALPALAL
ncbi:MAG: hypothetical protein LBD37_06240 [Treponema sp.]|jgi:hypothetical protein|nr:hypothetical protein [Treponema sp.]